MLVRTGLLLSQGHSLLKLTSVRQDAPIDAAPGYIASIPSTTQLLSAVRRSHTARQNILANKAPVRTEKLQQLPDHCSQPVVRDFKCIWVYCGQVTLSTCGTAMAAVIQGEHICTLQEPGEVLLPGKLSTGQLVLYQVSADSWQQASYSMGTSTPVLRWCPDKPCLCIAQQPRERQCFYSEHGDRAWDCVEVPSPHPAAFMVDGADGSMQHALGCEASGALHDLDIWPTLQHASWSPNCQYLLVCRIRPAADALPEGLPAGRLSIISLVRDKVLATSTLSVAAHSNPSAAASWLPSSDGIILSYGCIPDDPTAVQTAGFALGVLPEPYAAHSAGFSADGQHLVGDEHKTHSFFKREFSLLSCSGDGSDLILVPERSFSAVGMCWIPDTSSLLYRAGNGEGLTCAVQQVGHGMGQASPLKCCPPLFSPAGRFAVDSKCSGVITRWSIVDMQTHKQVWWLDGSKDELAKWPRNKANTLGPFSANQSLRNLRAHPAFCWLPCGSGLVCSSAARQGAPSTAGLDAPITEPSGKGLPALYFSHFA